MVETSTHAVTARVLVAGLGILSKYSSHQSVQDQMVALKKKAGELDTSTDQRSLLDALAAICVREPTDSYATAMHISPPCVTVYVASNDVSGVSESAVERLSALWAFMKAIQQDPSCGALKGSSLKQHPSLDALHSAFFEAQTGYSLPALSERCRDDAAIVIAAVSMVLRHDCANPSMPCLPHHCTSSWSQDDRTFLQELVSRIESMRHAAAIDPPNLSDLINEELSLYTYAYKRVQDDAKNSLFQLAETMSLVPIRYHLQRLYWLGNARMTITRIAHNVKYRAWFDYKLQIQPVPPSAPRDYNVDLNRPIFFRTAEIVEAQMRRTRTLNINLKAV